MNRQQGYYIPQSPGCFFYFQQNSIGTYSASGWHIQLDTIAQIFALQASYIAAYKAIGNKAACNSSAIADRDEAQAALTKALVKLYDEYFAQQGNK